VIQEVITIFVIATPHLHKGEGVAIPLHCCLRAVPEIASSPWLLAMTVIISVIASPTAVGRGNPRVLPRDCFGRLTPPSSQRSLPSFQHFATLVSKTKCCCV